MPDFVFYSQQYCGNSIPESDFARLSKRAEAQLNRYERSYTVSGDENARKMAICAMADALYYFETAANGGIVTGSAIGSVSTSMQAQTVDISEKAQSRELYRCASLYLEIYRGAGR